MTNPIVIVADDLTGAIDSAAPFAARGARVRIALEIDAVAEAAAARPQVLAIDTASRHLPPERAAERVAAAWRVLAPLAPALVIKKVDSRLQGPCGAETARLLAAASRTLAVVCPAVPDQQRIVSGGCLAGRGIAGPIGVAERFAGLDHTCPDARDAGDLMAVAAGILADPAGILAVGAAGLATALADRILRPAQAGAAPPPDLPMLIAIGSRDAITDEQVEHLRRACPTIDDQHPNAAAIRLHRMPRAPQPDPAQALARFAQATAELVQSGGVRTLLCSGGDTATAVMAGLAVRQLEPEGEWSMGVPMARVVGRPGLRLLTKSGGFGDADVLARIVRHARTGDRQDAA